MVIVVFAAAGFVSAARHARPQMVATEARKARRPAAALAKTGAADPTAHVKPLPPTPAAASVPSAAPTDAGKKQVFVGTGSKKNGDTRPLHPPRGGERRAEQGGQDERVQGGGPARRQVRLGLPRVRQVQLRQAPHVLQVPGAQARADPPSPG